MQGVRRHNPADESESYFMSMTDMMVGLLLIFIILLAYFALNLRSKTEELTGASEARAEILYNLQRDLEKQGLKVEIDTRTGVLRLPDDILFAKARFDLSFEGRVAVAKVAHAIAQRLPCYTLSGACDGQRSVHLLDAIFVEGHTDSDVMLGTMNNYVLSARRAEATFTALQQAEPILSELRTQLPHSDRTVPILSLSGYGPDRPVTDGNSEESKKRNRRIDLRFLMVTPDPGLPTELLKQRK